MRKLFLFFTLSVVATVVMAVPAKRGLWRTIQLSDGTEVKVQLVGDEHGHWLQAADGATYQRMADSEFYQQVDAKAGKERAKVRRSQVNAKRAMRLASRRVGEVGSYTGKKKGIIILVNFSDLSFKSSNNNALYQRIANEENFQQGNFKGSMADYFKAQSRGKFELDFDVVGPVKVSKKYSYYGENDPDADDQDKHPGEMVCEAVALAKDMVSDWKQYDWDGDGYVDQVYLIYAGKGEADGGGDDTIWPHAYDLYSSKYYGDGSGPVKVGTNLMVNTYACGPELSSSGRIEGIGTMCHEFSHCLGYPDFYDTDYSGGPGMGPWDLMDQGSYNGGGYRPAGFTSYERWVAGWQEPIVLEDEDVTVENMKSLQNGGESYIIYNKGNRNEYYLLENRQLEGWDASLPDAGLLIIHVDYNEKSWAENTPNDDPDHQRMVVVPADGKYQSSYYQGQKYYTDEGIATDPFPYNTVTAFNKDFKTSDNVAKKASQLFTRNTNGTYWIDSSVEDIKQNSNNIVSFKFVAAGGGSNPGGDEDDPVTPVVVDGALFYESFDQCDGAGGNDGKWNNIVGGTAALTPDNEGWVSPKAYNASKCARFGTGSVNGLATTPAIKLDGTTQMSFKAGAWNTESDATTLKLTANGGTVSPSSVTMTKGQFKDYVVELTGAGSVTVTFETTKGRFFLDEVVVADNKTVLKGDANGDGKVDVADVVAIVNKILENPSDNFNEKAADINGDGNIDVGDVVSVVNIILQGE